MSISPEASAAFYRLDQMTGGGVKDRITSGYRDPEHNARVGGAKNSQHIHGNAFDMNVADLSREQRIDLIRQAREAGFRGVGVYDNSLHFDVGPERAWGPSYSRDSLPEWYLAAFGGAGAPVDPQHAPQAPENRMNRLLELQMAANALPKWKTTRLDPRDFMFNGTST